MTLENIIKKGKKFGLALGASLALLTNAPQFNSEAYSQDTAKIYELPKKELKLIEIPFWRIAYSEGIVSDIDISGNNKVIVFEHRQEEGSDIFWMNVGGKEAVKLDLGPGFHREPSIDYYGRKIVFSSKTEKSKEEIYLADLDKKILTNISNNPKADFQPSIDDEGERIIFTSERDRKSQVYMINLKTEELINFSNDKRSWNYFPEISGNGKQVVFVKENDRQSICLKETDMQLCKVGEVEELKYKEQILEEHGNYWYMNPQINEDGTMIVWSRAKRQASTKKEIYLEDVVTGDKFKIFDGENSVRPSISANGEYVSWLEGSFIKGEYKIVVEDIKTGKIEKVGIGLPSEFLEKNYLSRNGIKGTAHFFKISPDGNFLSIFLPNESGIIYGLGNPHKNPGLIYSIEKDEKDEDREIRRPLMDK